MTRAHLPGSFRNGGRRIDTRDCPCQTSSFACRLSLDCPYGKEDTELASTHAPRIELVRSRPTKRLPAPRVQVQHYPMPRLRRAKRFFRDLVAFLTSSRWSR